ncbi:Zn-dependent hydrolase [Alkalicoccus saliphilus]|uniref:Zn-dependent hydrolase n=1 Tax=Alkalicoccus saliphilus TaxID=200989 RepID=UPI001C3F5337|nr:Zn-dependent hydrolase [Alkalicoccus saliphilus]
MSINEARLYDRFQTMNRIGETERGGLHRLALSDEDKQARDLLVDWFKELHLTVRVDDLGNIYGIKPGSDPSAKPVVIGSHLDSVPKGGKYDGTLGVLAALEIVESLIDEGVSHEQPVIVVNFTNEEGARFPKPMISSGVLSGVYQTEDMFQLADDSGITLGDELKRIGYAGEKDFRLKDVDKFIELHIEQGPVLIEQQAAIGIVEGIQGLSWHEATFIGEADHAGPSPMSTRKDAAVGAFKAMTALHEWVLSLEDETSITFGRIAVEPHVVNVIPGKAVFSIDIRHPEKEILEQRIDKMKQILTETALRFDLDSQLEDLSFMPPAPFSQKLVQDLENVCLSEKVSYHRMYSGAGHDAMYMNRLAETIMLFVPSIDGKSHNEKEESRWEDIHQCVKVMYELVKKQL